MHSYYCGLPPSIKDALAIQGRPDNLKDLYSKCQEIDHRHWQRKTEQNREQRTYNLSAFSSSTGQKLKSATSSSSLSDNKSDSKKDSGSDSRGAPKEKPPYADKLEFDGKLMPAEKARRIIEKLCLFCDTSGHKAEDCNKRKAALKALLQMDHLFILSITSHHLSYFFIISYSLSVSQRCLLVTV